MPLPLSAVEPFEFRGRHLFVKRDDTIDPLFSGNKYRKLYTLLNTPSDRYRKLVSYGGTQSNAMLSLAALCHRKGWEFEYLCKLLPYHVRIDPDGNLDRALDLGMQLIEVEPSDYPEAVERLRADREAGVHFVPQGGADPIAQEGIERLAEEIAQWMASAAMDPVTVVTPSGTGTTAYYLASALPQARVCTTAVVGNRDYLEEQMRALGPLPKNLQILEGSKKHHFAKPYPELLELYTELRDAGLEVDLVYGAKMWYELLEAGFPKGDETLLYLHSGGLIGNETMLERYRYKGYLT